MQPDFILRGKEISLFIQVLLFLLMKKVRYAGISFLNILIREDIVFFLSILKWLLMKLRKEKKFLLLPECFSSVLVMTPRERRSEERRVGRACGERGRR